MAFYDEISNYYDYIFPTGAEQINFIREIAGKPPKALLDIACGTGGYTIELAKLGYELTAADIDEGMVEELRKKLSQDTGDIKCIRAGMLEMKEKLESKFDLAFCIGNSIVHLSNLEEIQDFLVIAKSLLKKDGRLIIQIINFDRIILKEINELPAIVNEEIGLRFERYYRLDKEENRVWFRTVLSVDGRMLENEIPLFPLQSDDLNDLLKKAGFKKVKLFGDFNGSDYDRYNSYMLVLWAS